MTAGEALESALRAASKDPVLVRRLLEGWSEIVFDDVRAALRGGHPAGTLSPAKSRRLAAGAGSGAPGNGHSP